MVFLEDGEGCLLFTAFWWPIRQSPQLRGALGRSNETSRLPSSYKELRHCFQNITASVLALCWAACKPPWATSVCAMCSATVARSRFLCHILCVGCLRLGGSYSPARAKRLHRLPCSWMVILYSLCGSWCSVMGSLREMVHSGVWWDSPSKCPVCCPQSRYLAKACPHSQLLVPVAWKKIINLKLSWSSLVQVGFMVGTSSASCYSV